jgi:hypothetical protein
MRRNTAAVAIVVAIFLVGGGLAARTFGTRGQDAVARMSDDERALLAKLQSLRRGMSYQQVIAIMGEPDDGGPFGMRPKWKVDGSPLGQVAVYIHPDGARRILWISLGRFVYDQPLGT